MILTSASTESGTTTQVEINSEKTTVEIQNIASEIDAMLRRTTAESSESLDKENANTAKASEKDRVQDEPHERRLKSEDKIEEIIISNDSNNNETVVEVDKVVDTINKEDVRLTNGEQEIKPVNDKEIISSIEVKVVVSEVEKPEPFVVTQDLSTLRIVESEDEEDHQTEIIPEPVTAKLNRIEEIAVTGEENTNKTSTTNQPIEVVVAKIIQQQKPTTINDNKNDPYRNVVVEMEKYDVRYVALKGDEEQVVGAGGNINNNNNNNSKTVKDIIDSINKSQSLLKINVDEQAKRRTSNGSINTRIRELERKESECNEMLSEIDLDRKISGLYKTGSESVQVGVVDEIPVVIRELHKMEEEQDEQDDVNAMFKKCRPVSSGNHDWNPLPKPRRSHSSSPSSTPN